MRNPKLDRFQIAAKNVRAPWPVTREIIEAKQRYDRGEVEIVTGRDGETLLLYCIPRREIAKNRRPYFYRRDI